MPNKFVSQANAQAIFSECAKKFRYTEMPTPSAEWEGKVVQYMGDEIIAPVINYSYGLVPGNTYICMYDEDYPWKPINANVPGFNRYGRRSR